MDGKTIINWECVDTMVNILDDVVDFWQQSGSEIVAAQVNGEGKVRFFETLETATSYFYKRGFIW